MTSFRPCILIPTYNHGHALRGTIDQLKAYGLPIVIIDDGSDDDTKNILDQVTTPGPGLQVIVHEKNKGKGAALKTGFRAALSQGFTHALQIDADGQHNLADVPAFLSRGNECPRGLICGEPLYDASIPSSRLYGRRITNFWIAIETVSFKIPDAMCGFRLYPLRETVSLIEAGYTGNRMEFDIEILVRFVWKGLPIQWIKTKVRYPPGGRSNFRLFHDNVRIFWAHTRLVTEMPVHLPARLLKGGGACAQG